MLSKSLIAYFKSRPQPLTRDEIKIERKRLNKLLKSDHAAAIIELTNPRYDIILQELVKSHKRDSQLTTLSKLSINERKERHRDLGLFKKYGIEDDDKTAAYMARTLTPTKPPPRPGRGGLSGANRLRPGAIKSPWGERNDFHLDTSDYVNMHGGFEFSSDGTRMYIRNPQDHSFEVYNLGTPFDQTTVTYIGHISAEMLEDLIPTKHKSIIRPIRSTISDRIRETQIKLSKRRSTVSSNLNDIQSEIKRFKHLANVKPVGPPSRLVK